MFFFYRFQSFVDIAGCINQFKTRRGVLFRYCKNIKYTDHKYYTPSFFAFKCDHENNVNYKTKYFAKRNDSSYIYVTYIPVGCYNKDLKVPEVSYKYAYEYFSDKEQIPVISKKTEIGSKKTIRFLTKYFIQHF